MNPENLDLPTFNEVIEGLVSDIESLRSQLSARDAEVRALRGFAQEVSSIVLVKPSALWGYDVVGMLLRHALIGSDHKPTPLLDPQGSPGDPGPGGEK